MRYMVNEQDTTPELSLAIYRAALRWASAQGDRFEVWLDLNAYKSDEDALPICALGQSVAVPGSKRFGLGGRAIAITGMPGAAFANELTRRAAPADNLAGDVSPVAEVSIHVGNRRIYASFDYGSTQLFDLDAAELEGLFRALKHMGLDPTCIITAPDIIGS